MNPHKAYNFRRIYDKKFFILVFILIFQFIIYFSKNNFFKVPDLIVSHFSKSYFPHTGLTVSDIFIKPDKTFSIDYLSGRTGTVSFKIENIILKLDKDLSFKINNLLNLNIKKIDLTISDSKLSLKDVYLRKVGNEFRYNFILTNKFSKIKCNGMINNQALITFSNFKNDKGQKYTEFINNFQQFIKLQYSKIESSENLLTLLLNCNINQDIIVHAHQLNSTKNTSIYFEGLSSLIKIPFLDPKNIIVSLFIKNQNIFFKNTLITVKNLRFKRKESMNNEYDSHHLYFISNDKFIFSGDIEGNMNGVNIYIEEENHEIKTSFISDSNESEISKELNFNQLNKKFSLTGISQIYPYNFNLLFKKNNQFRNIIKGEKIRISLNAKKDVVSHIDFNAINFSVLDSPPGNYKGEGILDDNFSFEFSKSFASIGNSLVQGSFHQDFFPHRYSFRVSGDCEPNDLNNWFGNWWRKLWSEFHFHQNSIPHGDFKIDGIWGKSEEFHLFGIVKTNDISFRDLKLNQTEISIKVDENSSLISSPKITHEFGDISGRIKIPRINNKKDTITYQLDGNFPVNNGVKVFGPEIEDYINDLNSSDINISSHGSIPIQSNESNESFTTNSSAYEINFSTDKNGSWNGIKYNMIRGKITSVDDNFSIHIPQMISGSSELSFKSNFYDMDKYLVSLNLKDTPFDKILTSAVHYQNSTKKSILPNNFDYHDNLTGLVNLSFNGQGSVLDFSSLKGSGKLVVSDKNLRRIQLLGTLSESLDILPIPLPIGTLNFNELSGYFNLENDKMHFDKLILSSLLSKLTSKGYVNFNSGTINFTSNLNIVGNLIPFVDKIDPLSIISDIKLSGHWEKPNWKIQLSEIK